MHCMTRSLVVSLLLLPLVAGCSDYAGISPKAYDISSALYSTCRRADSANLQKLAILTKAEHDSSELSDREAEWINDIIAQANAGQWQEAAAESRSILEAQIVGR